MPESTDVSEKPEIAGELEGLTPDVDPEEERKATNGAEDEDLASATEDPARFLKEDDAD